jgi:hypothetical protein
MSFDLKCWIISYGIYGWQLGEVKGWDAGHLIVFVHLWITTRWNDSYGKNVTGGWPILRGDAWKRFNYSKSNLSQRRVTCLLWKPEESYFSIASKRKALLQGTWLPCQVHILSDKLNASLSVKGYTITAISMPDSILQ